jgi:hypothetical protein
MIARDTARSSFRINQFERALVGRADHQRSVSAAWRKSAALTNQWTLLEQAGRVTDP